MGSLRKPPTEIQRSRSFGSPQRKTYIVGYCQRCLNKRGEQKHFYLDYQWCIGCKNCTGCSLGSPGDSGSPVVQQKEGIETAVGIMRGGKTEFPWSCGIYSPVFAVKLSVFRNWMIRKMKEREKRHTNERAQNNMTAAFFITRRFRWKLNASEILCSYKTAMTFNKLQINAVRVFCVYF